MTWWDDAACRGKPSVMFFPAAGCEAAALAVCGRCPVTAECLADALRAEEGRRRWGVRGGLTADQRDALDGRPRRPRPPLAPCGTNAAYSRHLRHDEPPCAECRAAHTAHQASRRVSDGCGGD